MQTFKKNICNNYTLLYYIVVLLIVTKKKNPVCILMAFLPWSVSDQITAGHFLC